MKGSLGVTYDNNFNVISQTMNGGNKISFGYDNDGLLTTVGNPANGASMTLSYNSQNGLLTGTTLGNVTTSQTYSTFGELSSYTANYSSSPIFQTSYVRDSLGRITTLNETIQGVSKSMQYSYDPVGRLEKVWRNDTLVSQYVYDANGNRVAHITPTSVDSGTYDAQDRMLSYGGTQYIYTRNGDLQTKIAPNGTGGTDTTNYSYDALGNLMTVNLPTGDRIDYIIDGQNRRIAKMVNGQIVERWIYSGQLSPIAELDSAGNIIAQFVGGYMIKGGNTYRLITDHIGSVRLVVDINSGVVAERIDYDEFGNITYDSNPGFQPFGFAGGLYDTETKLVRFGARDYDASTGRRTSKDEILFGGRSASLFAYCGFDPVNFSDPSGLKYHVSCNGNNINVSASIVIYGPNATADMARKWQDAIDYYWNSEGKGFTINGKKVSVNVTVTADPKANWWFTAQSADNMIYVNEPGVRSWVWIPFGAWYGRWRSGADALTVAYETGHLFGLLDEYDEFWGTPKPGHEGEMMADQPGSTVSQREIESVVGSNCGCK